MNGYDATSEAKRQQYEDTQRARDEAIDDEVDVIQSDDVLCLEVAQSADIMHEIAELFITHNLDQAQRVLYDAICTQARENVDARARNDHPDNV